MDVSVGSAFIMAAAIVVALALFIGIVLFAGRRPYFKHPKQTPKQGTRPVTGGVHEGDPRSVAPRRDAYVQPAAGEGREPAWPETLSSRR